ncbi:disease resistance protein RGA5-like [Lolium rigidum]|uniref:disease resistance protein RGA5-like n=1 Tax=Lolium rigidum TaxID=89674 RepID=UPI001F5DC2F9|nr:disease resistance protein RGA5-like [Lolium rigidum]
MATYGAGLHNKLNDRTSFFETSNDQTSEARTLSFQRLEEITKSFSAERVLRSGIFGVVYKGVLQNGEMIAVKKLVASKPGFQSDFENECRRLVKLKHPNVARYIGCFTFVFFFVSLQAEMSSFGVTAPLLRKLDSLLPPKYRVPKPLADEIDLLKENLEEISAALLEQSMVHVPNKMGKLWMDEAHELSYDIEEFIDNMMQRFRVTAPGRRRKRRKKCIRKMRYVQTYRVGHVKIAWLPKALKPSAQIAEFRTLLREASDRYYRHLDLDGCTTSSRIVFTAHGKEPALYAKAANYLVGIENTKTELVKWLTNKEQKQLKVVPIVGPAGVGKTTLAKQVYRELGMQFECRAFVQASRKPDMRRLLGGILSQVQQRPGLSGSCTVQDLVDNLTEYLQDKRYIVVIDDLWETTASDILTSAFPEGNSRSRMIITAEFESVALGYCGYESNNIFKMKPLGSKDSGNLFFKMVFGSEIQCPAQLKDVSDIIIAKCSGLPLATICVAGLLASQRDNFALWQHVQQCLCSSLNTNASLEETLQEILKLSYNISPHYLKTCLMYVGMYPEGHTIWKVDLVNQWIAEDFISATEGVNTEEVAESYFSELVNRGWIQPVEITYNGEVLSCTVNHIVLDLIARKSSEDKFITALDYSQTITGLYSNARRLSLHFSNARYATKPKDLTLSKVRSFAFYGISKCMPSIVELKQLRVLILKFWGDHPESMIFDLTEICLLIQLRYLKISCDADVDVKLPTHMQILRYLETLIIDATVSAVPLDIILLPGSLRTLHYIDSGSNSEGNVLSIGELMNLQDLHITYYTEKLDEHLNRNLRELASSIGKLVNLKSFTLAPGASNTAVYPDFSSSRSSPSVFLQRLQLLPPICMFTRLPEWLGQLRKLCTLEVAVSELLVEDMDMLTGLSSLTSLSLYVWQHTTGRTVVKRGAFPVVKYFKYTCSVLSLAFQEEAFPNLQRLELSFNARRGERYDHLLAGIEYMLNLKEIAATIGAGAGAEQPDRMAAKSALDNAIRKHPSSLSYHIVNIADWIEEDYQFITQVNDSSRDSSDEHSRIIRKVAKDDTRARFWYPQYATRETPDEFF